MTKSHPTSYRPNVAVIVLNKEGEILVCERADRAGTWQIPQGGIEAGETAEKAMYRELEEEIGTREVKLLGRLPEPIRYEWPESLYERGYRGQEQEYFLVQLKPGNSINITPETPTEEFQNHCWSSVTEFERMLTEFKREAYLTAISRFIEMFPGTLKE